MRDSPATTSAWLLGKRHKVTLRCSSAIDKWNDNESRNERIKNCSFLHKQAACYYTPPLSAAPSKALFCVRHADPHLRAAGPEERLRDSLSSVSPDWLRHMRNDRPSRYNEWAPLGLLEVNISILNGLCKRNSRGDISRVVMGTW